MSRIHEALKKAELERSGKLEPPPAAPAEPERAAETAPAPAPSLAEESPSPLDAGEMSMAAFDPVTLDALRQRFPASHWIPDSKAVLFADPTRHAHPSGAEEFRTLRSRLYHIREKQPLQTVLVTSALPGEGKTFVALNLARAIARQQQRSVLVVDADLRRSRIHEGVGARSSPGLSDYLKGEVNALDILQRGAEDNFFVVAGGTPISDPVELLGTGRLRVLLNRFAPVFDWIILDSPPAVFLSDASLLAKVCDGVLMVVQSGSTPFDTAQKACREFPEKQLVGVVLNRVPPNAGYGYYYYYSEGYGLPESKNGKN